MVERLLKYQAEWARLSKQEQTEFTKYLETNTEAKKEIRALYKEYFHRDISGCGWCLLSGHLELIKFKPTIMKVEYKLKAGTVLHDPINKDISKMLTPQRLTEELALYHLAYNPRAIRFFTLVPSDVNERIAKFLSECGSDLAAQVREAGATKVEILTNQLAQARKAFEIAEHSYKDSKAKVEELKAKLEEANVIIDEEPSGAVNLENKGSEIPTDENGKGSAQTGSIPEQVIVSPDGQSPAKDTDRAAGEGEKDPEIPAENPPANLTPEVIPGVNINDDGDPIEFDLNDEVNTLLEAGLNEEEILEALDENVKAKQTTKVAIKKAVKELSKVSE